AALAARVNLEPGLTNVGITAVAKAQRPQDGGVELHISGATSDAIFWELVGQDLGGLKVASDYDIPELTAARTSSGIRLSSQPAGEGYSLQMTTDALSNAKRWTEVLSQSG